MIEKWFNGVRLSRITITNAISTVCRIAHSDYLPIENPIFRQCLN
jgi:hypothetical protein